MDNMFVVVTLTEKLLFCAKNSIEKNNILEDILSSFYVFCSSKDKGKLKINYIKILLINSLKNSI